MKALIIDNVTGTPFYAGLERVLRDMGWEVNILLFPLDIRNACINFRPDVLALDIALNPEEEDLLKSCKEKGDKCPPWNDITGMRLCYEITSEFIELPVALFTRHELIDLATESFAAGAWQFILKSMGPESAAAALRNIARTSVSADPFLYEVVSTYLDKNIAWENEVARFACERFYHGGSSNRRFVGLCASLAPLFARLFEDPAKQLPKYLEHMINSHSLLSISDPSMWDHVRHSGNVFWTGYLLLNQVPKFKNPCNLPGYIKGTYGKEEDAFDELMLAWTLASLFHDIGLAMEKKDRIVKFINSALGPGTHKLGALAEIAAPGKSIERLPTYLRQLGHAGKNMASALQWVIENWGKTQALKVEGENRMVIDHGILGAARMLSYLDGRVSDVKWPVCLHAATAVAFHNLPSLQLSFGIDKMDFEIPFGLLPVCSLLSLCDTIQCWDREQDPGGMASGETLLQLLENQDRAYIQKSEITKFSHNYDSSVDQSAIMIETRYFLRRGNQLPDICNMLRASVLGWATSGRGKLASKTFGFNPYFKCHLKYLLPFGAPVEIEF
jgi:DNA-binding NarL/FixJ family response regulator